MSTTAKKAPAKKASAKKTAVKKAPAKKAAARPLQASSPADFKKRRNDGQLITLPSGLTVLIKRVDLQSMVIQGRVPNALMPLVQEALEKGDKMDPQAMIAPEDEVDMEMVREMYQMVDEIVVASIVEPTVSPDPAEGEDSDDDLLYVSDIDDVDKMFMFQWCIGGTDDVASFLEEARANMAALEQGQGTGATTK